jgi:hypothetical protein
MPSGYDPMGGDGFSEKIMFKKSTGARWHLGLSRFGQALSRVRRGRLVNAFGHFRH